VLAFAGYGVCVGNWLSLLILTVPIAFAFVRRIQVEETALNASLGEAYREYSGRTRRLVPLIY
jgi:protein-S-isoprenylcysteine O-methyltransferase